MKKRLMHLLFLCIALSVMLVLSAPSPVLAQTTAVSPSSGPVGTTVSVTGSGFTANAAFTTYFAYGTSYQVPVDSGTVSSSGNILSSFSVPSVPAGTYTIRVQTSTAYAAIAFGVISAIDLNVSSVIVGNQVTVTGTGFRSNRTVTIRFDNSQITTTSTNNAGRFSTSFSTPEAPTGIHTITATDGTNTKVAELAIIRSMTLAPSSGNVGTIVTVSGTGFNASRIVRIYYDGINVTTIPSAITTSSVGSFSAKFTVPAGPTRTVQVSASDSTGSTSSSFKLTATIRLTPANGKVDIPVTVDGSGFNANRQITLTFDTSEIRQVSTDAFGSFSTVFDVPQATGGQHVVTANDGIRTISATFTVASNIVITPNAGKVGTAVHISGSGYRNNHTIYIYFDNTIVATTQTNINGSFSTTFNIAPSTGGTHTISANDGVFMLTINLIIQPSITLNQKRGKMGDQITVTGTGFDAGNIMNFRLGTTQVGSTATDADGSFSEMFYVPQLNVGSYNFNASDGTNMASSAFEVITSFDISPTSGYVGSAIAVKGGGYNGLVTIKYDDITVATVAASAEGSFSTTFLVPASVHGYHTVFVNDKAASLQTTFSMESTPPPAPLVLTPASLKRENARPTFTWQGVNDPSGVSYHLQIANDASFNTIVMEKEDLATTQYIVSKPEKLKATSKELPYYWRVKAIDLASNEGQWSTPDSFYVSFMAEWLKYTLIGLGATVGALLIFWMGMITGKRRMTRGID